ncbi:MAG: PilZ domain-containing protein [Candidatus Polarisedimenticolia bacterium]
MRDDLEKRRFHRFMALLEVRVLPGERIPGDLRLSTIDIAAGGARCAVNRPLDAQTRLQLTFTMVGGDLRQPAAVDAEALVLRCKENPRAPETRRYEVALEFVRMEPEDRKRLVAYLNSL